MKAYRENNNILYTLVAAFLRGAIKGLALSATFLAARDYLRHR